MIAVPEEAVLGNLYVLPEVNRASFSSYETFARSRILYTDDARQRDIEDILFGTRSISTALYVQSISITPITIERPLFLKDRVTDQRVITILGIWVNTEVFGDENRDLMPYVEEHEVREGWILTTPGETVESAHAQAREWQYKLAGEHGKARKLLDFHLSCNTGIEDELRQAYALTI